MSIFDDMTKQLNFESIEIITKMANYYKEWLEWNKYNGFKFRIINIKEEFKTEDIIIIHNMWEENTPYTISNGEYFLKEICYALDDWLRARDFEKDEFKYLIDFWGDKVDELISLSF